MSRKRTAVIIITFNISHLIKTQVNLLRKFCKDSNLEIIVVDNSSNLNIAAQIKDMVDPMGVQYVKANIAEEDFSQSHAGACNFAYRTFKDTFNYMLFLDHDNFPIEDFSVEEVIKYKYLAGVGQARSNKYYFWPGCLIVNNDKIEKRLVDFSTSKEFGLDTGGMLYQAIEKYTLCEVISFDQYDIPNPNFNGWHYNIIKNQKHEKFKFGFMHFINGSNWNKLDNNNERLNSLIEILKTHVGDLE